MLFQIKQEPMSVAVLPTPTFPSRLSWCVISMKIHTMNALAERSLVHKWEILVTQKEETMIEAGTCQVEYFTQGAFKRQLRKGWNRDHVTNVDVRQNKHCEFYIYTVHFLYAQNLMLGTLQTNQILFLRLLSLLYEWIFHFTQCWYWIFIILL